ncbi:MAG: hypothetical protein GF364_19490 [Candidatus Lokiarchaeota archaeon]|nr:hypothetical protein [Candidatus Lokiarchaeota archaeon]
MTIHTPIPFIAGYMLLTRKHTLSIPAIFMILPFGLTWLFALDDLQNGTLNGPAYLAAALPMITLWTLIYVFVIMKRFKNVDPLIGPVIKLKSLKLIEYRDEEEKK